MKVIITLVFSVILLSVAFSNSVEADKGVYIPDHEYTGFFDNDGIYTVIAGIKNQENFAVVPTLTVSCLLYTSPSQRDGLLSRMPS